MSNRSPASLAALSAYADAHNDCVRAGSRDRLRSVLAVEASVIFASGRAGPFVGRDAILEAFLTTPPTDTLEIAEILWSDEESVLARYAWSGGESEGGRLYLTCRDRLATLVVVLPGG